MHYLIPFLASATFTIGLSGRVSDPVLPAIAADFSIAITVAALVASAYAFSYALVQPVMGFVAEKVGKPRVIMACLLLVGVGNILGAYAPTFELFLVTRAVSGIGAGGIIPVVLAFVSDNVPLPERQVTMSRILAGTLTGSLLGGTIAGLIGDFVGWRSVYLIIGIMVLISAATVIIALRKQPVPEGKATDFKTLMAHYRAILSHPHAPICFPAVFLEGICIMGMFPYVSTFVREAGEPRLAIGGLVLAGFALGGIVYSASVKHLLKFLGPQKLMATGGVLACAMLVVTGFTPPWPAQFAALLVLGCAFFMTHASIQMFTTEIAPNARAMATSVHSFALFLGQMIGPIAYGIGLSFFGKLPTLSLAAAGFLGLALFGAVLLHRPRPDVPTPV